jgi:NAD(P)-dependent dehydrogenase (short-subunit alcohol dehydrogenase family)
MAARAEKDWGGVDILVNNAGVLRDKTFAKMEMADFELVLRVHLIGSANCTKAVWAGMRERNYGRIVLTSSGSGIYGNFWPGELRRREGGHDWPHERPSP